MSDKKDSDAAIYSKIADALGLLDGALEKEILAIIDNLMKWADRVVDDNIRNRRCDRFWRRPMWRPTTAS